MATLQTQSTTGDPLTVTYPAERPSGPGVLVRLRVGKKTFYPAYTNADLPHLVQFQRGQQIVMFALSDLLQTSYWQKIRNAYNLLGQLDLDAEVKVGVEETQRVLQWLEDQSASLGIYAGHTHGSDEECPT